MTISIIKKNQSHGYHMVMPSPWPFDTSLSLWALFTSLSLLIQKYSNAQNLYCIALIVLIFTMSFWFRDIIFESTYLGCHTEVVQKNIIIAIGLFILSEALFFLAIFWTYFHSSISPSVELGEQWPPKGLEIPSFEIPLLNTVLLLCSGITVTYSHHSIIKGNRKGSLIGLYQTLGLALLFTGLQYLEYNNSSFTISDGIFGSCFYFSTGFHGLHVLIGTAFLAVGLWRIWAYHITDNHHLGLQAGILYWHFVDVVWVILLLCIY